MTALVFENAQGEPENLHGVTVGVAVLALDTFDDLIPSMHYLSEVTTAWEVSGGAYARDTIALSYAIEGGDGVLRYASGVPTFDLAGIDPVNAVVFYKTTGGSDAARELLFALSVPEGAGFDGWTANEPADGLWRIGKPAHNDLTGRDAVDAHPIASITGLTAALAAAGSVALPPVPFDIAIAADAIDGTGDQFTPLQYDSSATAAGIVPDLFAGYDVYVDMDATFFAGLLASAYPSGATILVYSGGVWSVREVSAATIGAPWTEVPASVVVGSSAAWGLSGFLVSGEFTPLAALTTAISEQGVFAGLPSVGHLLNFIEAYVADLPRHGSTYFLAPVDPALFAGAVADIDQPVGDDGVQVARGDHVLTAGDLDVDGNGYISHVHPTTGQWGKVPSAGAATPSGAGAWDNAITTNKIDSGFLFFGEQSIVIFRGYRSGTTISGQPANATRPLRTGEWVVYATGSGADVAADTHAATSKTTPVDADELALVDSAASNGLKKLTWANLKTALGSVFVPQTRTINGVDLSANRTLPDNNWLPNPLIAWSGWTAANNGATRAQHSGRWFSGYVDTPNTSGSYAEWQFMADAGTWTLLPFGDTLATAGTATLKIDGVTVGTWNQYSASTAVAVAPTAITGITISTNGVHTLRAENTSDGAGGGKVQRYSGFQFIRTA